MKLFSKFSAIVTIGDKQMHFNGTNIDQSIINGSSHLRKHTRAAIITAGIYSKAILKATKALRNIYKQQLH